MRAVDPFATLHASLRGHSRCPHSRHSRSRPHLPAEIDRIERKSRHHRRHAEHQQRSGQLLSSSHLITRPFFSLLQHLICLVLQTLGIIALNPDSHEILTQADIPDSVLHLILPADEMFYTNQTTKFARYVKHLGARILVYMGLLTKVSNKVNLFDILGKTTRSVVF